MNDKDFWMQYRMGLLQILDAIERHLEMLVTTADIRYWFKHKGPRGEEARDEIERLRRRD